MVANSRIAIVTGGTTGLGAVITELLAKNGYKVLATSLSDSNGVIPALLAQNLEVRFISADLLRPSIAAKEITQEAISAWGRIDLVVNCAAMIVHKRVEDVSDKDWDCIFAVNLKAPFFLAQAALPYLEKSKGSIINISSTNAWNVNLKNQLYDSLKAGLNHLTKGLALEFRERGVRVNALMPGAMNTPLLESWLEEFKGGPATKEDFSTANIAEPIWIARAVLALASPDCAWINGAEIPIDGGFSLG